MKWIAWINLNQSSYAFGISSREISRSWRMRQDEAQKVPRGAQLLNMVWKINNFSPVDDEDHEVLEENGG